MAHQENVISIYPKNEERFGLSYAVKAGKTIYLSGLLAADDDFNLVGENDMEAQIRCIYERMQFVLGKCCADLCHVVSEINFTTNTPELSRASWVESVYAIVYFDAVRVKIRDEGLVKNKAVYLAIGYTCDGYKQILGMWVEQTEGAKFWLSVMNDLKARGLKDILIAVVDGLSGFPEAIETAYPRTLVQTCIVHLIRNSMAYGSWKERKLSAAALKAIYQAENAGAALAVLAALRVKAIAISPSWIVAAISNPADS